MKNKLFWQALANLGISFDEKKAQLLDDYHQLLVKENQKYNLTRLISNDDVYWKHYYDSLTIVEVIDLEKINTVCDVGTGPGIPGLVLKIFFPHIELYLVESNQKKGQFLQKVVAELNLNNVTIVNKRAEEYPKRDYFDLVVTRATAPLPVIVELTTHLVRKNGKIVFYVGDISREINTLGNKLKSIFLKISNIKELEIPQNKGKRTLVCCEKTQKTPLKYPRQYAQIKKKPLF